MSDDITRTVILLKILLCLFGCTCKATEMTNLLPDDLDDELNGHEDGLTINALYFEEGDFLKVNCSLPSTLAAENFTSADIGFYRKSPWADLIICMQDSDVRQDDSTSSTLSLRATVADAGTYTCFVPKENCRRALNVLLITSSSDVDVEYRVQNVTNFSCIVEDWDTLVCNWTHPVEYINSLDIEVSFTYMVEHDEKIYKCTNLSFTSCKTPANLDKLDIEVTVTNKRTKRKASNHFFINARELVKPAAVSDLWVVPSSPGCFSLSWSHNNPGRAKVFRIRQHGWGQAGTTMETLVSDWNETTYKSCGFPSYSKHSFLVDCRPSGVYSGDWSEAQIESSTSLQTAPSVGPAHTPPGYVSGSCDDKGYRTVQLFWGDVPESERNGKIDSYVVKVGRSFETVLDLWANVNVTCAGTTEVQVFSHNKAGRSLQPSVWHLSPVWQTVPAVIQGSFAVVKEQSQGQEMAQRVTWDWDDPSANTTVTVIVCQRPADSAFCQKVVSWLEALVTQRGAIFEKAIPNPTTCLFGISYRDPKTQIHTDAFFTNCMFIEESENPEIPVASVPSVEGGEESLIVMWDKDICGRSTQAKVTANRIKWRVEGENEETAQSVTVPSNVSHQTIKGLKAGELYLVTIQRLSHDREGPEVEPWVQAIPLEMRYSGDELDVVLIALGTVVAAVVVIVLVAIVLKRCMKRKKSFQLEADRFIDEVCLLTRSGKPEEKMIR